MQRRHQWRSGLLIPDFGQGVPNVNLPYQLAANEALALRDPPPTIELSSPSPLH